MSATDLSAFRRALGHIPARATDATLRQALEHRIEQWASWDNGAISHLWRRLPPHQLVNFGRGIGNFAKEIEEGHIRSTSDMPTPKAVHSWLEMDDLLADNEQSAGSGPHRTSAARHPHTSQSLAKPELSRRYAAVSGIDKRRWDARAQRACGW